MISVLLALMLTLSIPQVALAAEPSGDEVVTTAAVGVAETRFASSSKAVMSEEQKRQYEQMLEGDRIDIELEVGESKVIGHDEEGAISISCVDSRNDSTRGSNWTSYRTYEIKKTILGIEYVVVRVSLECSWYADGLNGRISNLIGTYYDTNFLWSCWLDSFKVAGNYNHALWLNTYSSGSTYLYMFAAGYNPYNSTLSFSMVAQ